MYDETLADKLRIVRCWFSSHAYHWIPNGRPAPFYRCYRCWLEKHTLAQNEGGR